MEEKYIAVNRDSPALSPQPLPLAAPPPSFATRLRTCCNRKNVSCFMICMITVALFADQSLMSPTLQLIADEFGMTDDERDTKLGGEISLGFFIVGAPVSLIIGYLSDKWNRKYLYIFVVLLGEVPCLATQWVTTYTQLFWLRTITGIAVGGALPLIMSIFGDMYSSDSRAIVASLVTVATGAGQFVGAGLAGFAGPIYGWRFPFVATAVPSIFLALLSIFLMDEPPRGGAEHAVLKAKKSSVASASEDPGSNAKEPQYNEKISWAKIKLAATIPSNIIVFAQALPGCIPWGVFNTFYVTFLTKSKGYSIQYATTVSVYFSLGCSISGVMAGFIGQYVYTRHKRWLGVFLGLTTCLGCSFLLIVINFTLPAWLEAALSIAAGLFSVITGPNVKAILTNINAPETRGCVFAVYNEFDDLGKGLGPYFGSLLMVSMGRLYAFNFSFCFWYACGIILFPLYWYMERDEISLQRRVAQSIGCTEDAEVLKLDYAPNKVEVEIAEVKSLVAVEGQGSGGGGSTHNM